MYRYPGRIVNGGMLAIYANTGVVSVREVGVVRSITR